LASHPCMTAWRVHRRGGYAIGLLLAVVSAASVFRSAFVTGWPGDLSRKSSCSSLLSREVYSGGHGGTGVILLRPPVKGFGPEDTPNPRELSPVVPGFKKQEYLYFKYAQEGYPTSEVFMKIDGKTIWKKVGEVAAVDGDFERAVYAQWYLLAKQSYLLFKKAHFFMVKPTNMKFGYTNEKAEIVECDCGPMPEATEPLELRGMLNECGFLPQQKPVHWRHMTQNAKSRYATKGDRHRNPSKSHLLDRRYNQRLQAHKWYNPDKYLGRYTEYMRKKRGLVVGVVSGAPQHAR